ncbi:ARM repeat-containing protein [Laetiporus sulphureus 93-53]|uniref:ARM repeat-containing protein n=1 Tax=Laetiporus sulphureus 93-53 TaxID=1314785 RepID=A0A165B1W8_9APHY|nr:ARM repeat-containing protein [Laetiporus sulphureus 93-53]KZT00076.1 ARM repeat-containing protein [Laetiporus sulphureus 93-53]
MVTAVKTSKKRPAVSQAGPKLKKLHTEPPQSSRSAEKLKKRSKPITRPVKEEDSDLDGSNEERTDEGSDEEPEEPDEERQDHTVSTKDPNAARESHKAQRALLEQRRAVKPHSVLLTEAKRIWQLAHRKDIPKAEREQHIKALMNVIRDNVNDIVLKHDASRIVQTVMKYGRAKERNEVAVELKGKYKELVQSRYSKFLVMKVIRFCPSHRASILREFQGHVLRLLLHREASSVLADAFELYTNAYERSLLLRDFYGKEASLLTITAGSSEEQERSKKGLRGILEGVEGERRKRLLSALKENLVTIFNNPDKGAVSHAIVHRALWEYLAALNTLEDETEQEKLRREIFESCEDVLAEMVHTKDGSRSVREFIAHGTAKDRKQIVKVLKPHVIRMCTDDEAQLVLFTCLDVIDDTKLTVKSLVSDITASAQTLYQAPQGRRSLIYLVAPRTRRHFTPAQIALMEETDAIRTRTSKKDDALRAAEILRAASDGLLSWIVENGVEVSRDPGGSLVICEVMLYAEGDKTAASETLLKALSAPYPSTDLSNPHPISLPHTARMYKTLLQGGHYSQRSKSIEAAPLWSAQTFATKFVQVVPRDATVALALGEGAFVLAALCEQLSGAECEERETLKGWFGDDVERKVEEVSGKGASVLLAALNALH